VLKVYENIRTIQTWNKLTPDDSRFNSTLMKSLSSSSSSSSSSLSSSSSSSLLMKIYNFLNLSYLKDFKGTISNKKYFQDIEDSILNGTLVEVDDFISRVLEVVKEYKHVWHNIRGLVTIFKDFKIKVGDGINTYYPSWNPSLKVSTIISSNNDNMLKPYIAVEQMDVVTKKVLHTYINHIVAATSMELSPVEIQLVLKGSRQSLAGYCWRFYTGPIVSGFYHHYYYYYYYYLLSLLFIT